MDILAEARSLIPEKMQAQVQKMKDAFEGAAEEMGGKAEVEVEVMYPGFKFADGDHVVEIAKKAAAKIGRNSELLHSGGGSDANVIAGFGIPTVNLLSAMRKFIQQMNVCQWKNYISLQR